MMALAKVTWEDGTGASYAASVTIEDTSSYGACIRTRAPITIGSRLKVDWRGGRFSGVAKYCRQYREDFIVGIQRDMRDGTVLPSPSPVGAISTRPTPMVKPQSAPDLRPDLRPQPPSGMASRRLQASTSPATVPPSPTRQESNGGQAEFEDRTPARVVAERPLPGPNGIQTEQPSAREAKTSMLTKWLRRESRQEQKDVPNGKMAAAPEAHDGRRVGVDSGIQRVPSQNRPSVAGPAAPSALLQLEDIYRAKGIIGLRMGYNINKVVEMLNSDHARDLPSEMKRASVLMALDAAGISLDDVLRDAALRLDALNTYEADQEKHLAEYESQKVQENAEIQAEMERVTAHYLERLKRNMDEVTQMRSPFAAWQAMKQQEAQKIAEAVELCSKGNSENASDSPSPISSVTPASRA